MRLMAGHGCCSVVQYHQEELVSVVDGVDEPRDSCVEECGVSYERNDRLVVHHRKPSGCSDARAHAYQQVGGQIRGRYPKGVAADVRCEYRLPSCCLVYCEEGGTVRAASAQDGWALRQVLLGRVR